MGNILEIKDLSKNFKGLKAVDSVSFAVEEGGITGLIGSNGAGKTTVFNMISGVFPPTAGHIIYKNKEITGMKPYHYTSMGIARTFQIMKPLASMSVLDNVASGALYGRKKYKSVKEAKEYAEEILHFTGLYERKDWLPGEMEMCIRDSCWWKHRPERWWQANMSRSARIQCEIRRRAASGGFLSAFPLTCCCFRRPEASDWAGKENCPFPSAAGKKRPVRRGEM